MNGRTGIAAFLVAIVALGVWLTCLRTAPIEAVAPVESGLVRFSRSFKTCLRAYFARGPVASENVSLRTRVRALEMELDDAKREIAAYARLRESLALATKEFRQNQWLAADVVSHGGTGGIAGVIRLGRGSADGVKENAPVAVPEGLVGRVERVSTHECLVRLTTDPAVRISCEVQMPGVTVPRVIGVAEGIGRKMRLRHLDPRPVPPPGAKITTSGLGGVFPRGITVGRIVGEVTDDGVEHLELECDVEPAIDHSSLETVFIRRED